MKLPPRVLAMLRANPDFLPLEPLHGWRSSPDEGGHTHCSGCGYMIEPGDPCVAKYLEYVSITFCPACVADNPEVFREWVVTPPAG